MVIGLFASYYDAYKDYQYCKHGVNSESICKQCDMEKNGNKMTIVEALKIINDLDARNKPINKNEANWLWLKRLEALGVLKFDEEKKEVNELYYLNTNNIRSTACSVETNKIVEHHGVIRLEQCSEGLVLWVGGEIVWKSWETYFKKGDAVTIEYYVSGYTNERTQAGIIK